MSYRSNYQSGYRSGYTSQYPGDGTFTPPAPPASSEVWLKADAGVLLSGSDVVNWTDQAGAGYVLGAFNSSLYPAFRASSLNGLPGITFPGAAADKGLVITSANPIAAGSARTVVVVCKTDASNPVNGAPFSFRVGTPNFDCYFATIAGTNYVYSDGATTNQTVTFTPAPSTGYYLKWTFDGNTAHKIGFVANRTTYPTTTAGAAGTPSDSGATGFCVGTVATSGGGAGTAGQSFSGDINEIFVYDHVLTVDEDAAMDAYIHFRYGL